MEEQRLERAKERKKKEAEGRKSSGQELSKLEKEIFMTHGGTHKHEDKKVFSYQRRVKEWQEEALELKFLSPRFKCIKDQNTEYIKPVTVMLYSTKWDKKGCLEIPRPKAKEVVMKLSDEIGTRKRIEPEKSKVEFRTVNEEKSEREKISIEAVEATFYPKAEETKEKNVLKVHTKEFINEVKFEKRRLKIPKKVENGRKIIVDLKSRRVTFVGTSAKEEASEEGLELQNFFELLLGNGAGEISGEKPICIIVEETKEKYENFIAVLCRDIYREKIGGKPTPIYRKTIKDLRHEWESLVERKIIVIENVEEESEELLEILKGFFAQDMGFLILVSTHPLKLEDAIRKGGEQSANILIVTPSPEIERIRDELLGIVRGKKSSIQAKSFGEEFKKSAEDFDDTLMREYLDHKKAPEQLRYDWDKLVASSPDGDEDASPIHSAMKAFVWMYEWKKHEKKIIPKLEKIEEGDSRSRIVDVKIEDRNYEIETLFGVGDAYGKLTKKIKNYNRGEKVYFVLKNLDILRNLPLFLSFRRDWRKAGYKVEFFGLDLDKEELVPLNESVKFVKSVFEANEGKNAVLFASSLYVEDAKFNGEEE